MFSSNSWNSSDNLVTRNVLLKSIQKAHEYKKSGETAICDSCSCQFKCFKFENTFSFQMTWIWNKWTNTTPIRPGIRSRLMIKRAARLWYIYFYTTVMFLYSKYSVFHVFFQMLWWAACQSAGWDRPAPPTVGRTLHHALQYSGYRLLITAWKIFCFMVWHRQYNPLFVMRKHLITNRCTCINYVYDTYCTL